MAEVGKLQEEAVQRKERLRALKHKSGNENGSSEPPEKIASGRAGEKLPK